ncbi:AraC family transcriptional regulator [Gloeocapsopsis sp. IPPAS B-1203]|uniref:helix-turn-helix domain-containing protein n=1 Tax=Gloeocapsopsis sp. IPPAS B-1203 TaxID=2049454 RepID=UPI000C176BE9|nr:AraC family transcriptional regulator [Gloeocapsopsis sp. IPPAS B-1203]PIG94608.1 AraC family transcriptional regulator [Gloeocapsopsis sp. IPPAS B-1203]
MAIILSQSSYWELFEDTVEVETNVHAVDEFDTIWKYPQQLGQGYWRDIVLGEGLSLTIADYQPHDDIISAAPERQHPLEYTFYLAGGEGCNDCFVRAGQYTLCGSGVAPKEDCYSSAQNRCFIVNAHIAPALFQSFLEPTKELPQEFKHLLRDLHQEYSISFGKTTAQMHLVLQQILQCPYHGFMKRIYLESKIWELIVLLLDQLKPQKQQKSTTLKSDDIERIYQAQAILLQQLSNPPSLIELARKVGLNDCTLKRGFRQVFGKTAFAYLHHHRLEQAKQLLAQGDMSVAEVALSVGFADRSYFTTAFRKQYGCNPGAYRRR